MSEQQLRRAQEIADYLVDEVDADVHVRDLLDALATYGYRLTLAKQTGETTDVFNAYLLSLLPEVDA